MSATRASPIASATPSGSPCVTATWPPVAGRRGPATSALCAGMTPSNVGQRFLSARQGRMPARKMPVLRVAERSDHSDDRRRTMLFFRKLRRPWYALLQFLSRLLVAVLFGYRSWGRQHVPKVGGAL